ncbi:tetratricopeptide repeat protein [Nocardia rhamnosiphila]|uniref:tetratricopeptide repeat protein n=1 Tax=Nocardia rhamnosiphila TaxID=426716 RepID=UPI0033C28A4C
MDTDGGNFAGTVITGDDSCVLHLPPEAWRPIAQVDALPGLNNLPVRPGRFVGRDRELDLLDTALVEPGRVLVHAVHGLGGIGKSTLVAHWAATRPHGHSPIWWITADTKAAVEQELARFAAGLQPALAKGMAVEELTACALQWLAAHTGWLLILDNVNDPADIAQVLARAGTGPIVITSRVLSEWHPDVSTVRLDVLGPGESLRLLIDTLSIAGSRDSDGAAELSGELGYLPLAIKQAGAYLAQNPFTTPRVYLGLLTDYPAEMYDRAASGFDPERTIARIWRVSLDRVAADRPAAADLLRILAWYGPDAIPISLVQHTMDPPTLDDAIRVLAAYSLIIPDPATATVSIHRLVQAVARTPGDDDPHRRPEAVERARTEASTWLCEALPRWEDPAAWPLWRTLLPHIGALLGHSNRDTNTSVTILNETACFFLGQGLTTPAMSYLHRSLAYCEQFLGPEDPSALITRNNLAHAYQLAGCWDEAISLCEQTFADFVQMLGIDDPRTVTARHNLASAYSSVGRTNEAIEMYEQNLAVREKMLTIDHPGTLTTLSSMASAYEASGRLDKAIPLHKRALEGFERILGIEHPETLTTRHGLAYAYQLAGRTEEAIRLYEPTFTARREILTIDHPHTLSTCNNLAHAYELVGRIDEAIEMYEQTLEGFERILGIAHSDTLTVRHNLAHARVRKAISLWKSSIRP